MTVAAGQRLGDLLLLSRVDGRRWRCLCSCGRIETYRWSALRSDLPNPVKRCTVCDSRPCRTCSAPVPRSKTRYCSVQCRTKAEGLRQAEYYRQRMRVPALRERRQREVKARRLLWTDEQRKRRRAQNRSWFSRLSPAKRDAVREYRRRWYLAERERLSSKRRTARLSMTPEQRADLANYMHCWYQQRADEMQNNAESLKANRRRRQIAMRRWSSSVASENMAADVRQLMESAFD